MKEFTLMRNPSVAKSVTRHSETRVILRNMKESTLVKNHSAVQNVITNALPGFPGTVDVRLINPAKSQLGKVTKIKLQGRNALIRGATGLNQWRRTKDVIQWFEGLDKGTGGGGVELSNSSSLILRASTPP